MHTVHHNRMLSLHAGKLSMAIGMPACLHKSEDGRIGISMGDIGNAGHAFSHFEL